MNGRLILFVLVAVTAIIVPGWALADPCATVEREMTFGEVALEQAADKSGYLKSAKEFEAATKKAPECASAHFNLGLVMEKAGQFDKARQALSRYLELAPSAPDAPAVTKRIYRLEYLARNAPPGPVGQDNQDAAKSTRRAAIGNWIETNVFGTRVNWTMIPEGADGLLLQYGHCLSNCDGVGSNPVRQLHLRVTGDGELTGTLDNQLPAFNTCRGQLYSAPATVFLSQDNRSIVVKVGPHDWFNTHQCRFEKHNGFSFTLTRG